MKRLTCIHLLIFCLVVASCTIDEDRINSEQQPIDSVDSLPSNDISNDSIIGENLLLNNGVEKWDMDFCEYPDKWLIPHGYCNKVTRNREIVLEGQYSAKMKALESGVTARIAQLVKITPGCRIRIRFNYYVEQWKTNGARTYCYFRTGAAENTSISISNLREIYTNDEYYIFRGGGYGKAYLPHTPYTWSVFDETITVPSNANYFEFGINSYLGTIIYVDNFYVVDVTY